MRGDAGDFDRWAGELGCEGWSYEDVLPYFVKSENNANPMFAAARWHGRKGPMAVSDANATYDSKIKDLFLDAARELGFVVGDINAEHSDRGVFMQNQVLHCTFE